MKILFLLFILFYIHSSFASTRATFFGVGAMVQVIPQSPNGTIDRDGQDLYEAMNVPVQDSIMGPGKAIQTQDQAISFTCAIRNNTSYECSIVFNQSRYLQMDMINKKLKFHVSGAIATEIRQKFFLKDNEFHFKAADGLMKVDAVDDEFTFLYSAQGV